MALARIPPPAAALTPERRATPLAAGGERVVAAGVGSSPFSARALPHDLDATLQDESAAFGVNR